VAYTAYQITDRIKSEHATLEEAQNSPIKPNAVIGEGRAWCRSALALDVVTPIFWSETTVEFVTKWLREAGCEECKQDMIYERRCASHKGEFAVAR
jgi:hypothetical protein